MKSLLLFCILLAFINSNLGGWKRGSFRENDFGIDRAFRKAFEIYKSENSNSDIDFAEHLTIYKQMANGINYRMCFIDLKSNLNVVQEYIISGPSFGTKNSDKTFKLFEKNTYKPKQGLVSVSDSRYPRIQNTLFGSLKNTKDNLLYISKVEQVETYLDNFYIVTGRTEEKEHVFVVRQSKLNSDEYEALGKLK